MAGIVVCIVIGVTESHVIKDTDDICIIILKNHSKGETAHLLQNVTNMGTQMSPICVPALHRLMYHIILETSHNVV